MSTIQVGPVVFFAAFLLAVPLSSQNQKGFNQWPEGQLPPARSDVSGRTGASVEPTVSADVLRNPISQRTHRMLQRALDCMRSGKHKQAIYQLKNTLAKDPASAAYVHSLLGLEYMNTNQFAAAVQSFEQAVLLLPHDAINRANFGISLAATGDYERAEEEARRARDLQPENPEIQRFLDSLAADRRLISERH